jgi:hypothetical protein
MPDILVDVPSRGDLDHPVCIQRHSPSHVEVNPYQFLNRKGIVSPANFVKEINKSLFKRGQSICCVGKFLGGNQQEMSFRMLSALSY